MESRLKPGKNAEFLANSVKCDINLDLERVLGIKKIEWLNV